MSQTNEGVHRMSIEINAQGSTRGVSASPATATTTAGGKGQTIQVATAPRLQISGANARLIRTSR